MRDPKTGVARWFVPGGAIEPNETAAQAAERETLEETGYRVRVDATRELVLRYPFEWHGVEFDCTTHFFRAELEDPEGVPARVDDASYHEGVGWVSVGELDDAIGFHASIHRAVVALL